MTNPPTPPGSSASPAFPASSAPPATSCARCGAILSGRFCSQCGAAAGPRECAACRAALSPGARFCHRCGAPVGTAGRADAAARPGGGQLPWIVAGAAALVAVIAIVWRGSVPTPAPDMANPGSAGPASFAVPAPDISRMSPRERFDRLFERVVRAFEAEDTATVIRLSPMALGAYALLDRVDADARYHVGVIQLALGEHAAAGAVADTLLRESPGHLLGYVLRGEVADRRHRLDDLTGVYREFLQRYDEELAKGRPEYADHRPVLDDFRTRARASVGGG